MVLTSGTMASIVVLLACALLALQSSAVTPPPKHYNIVLFGATGDLAQKYLWNGLYSLFVKEHVKGKVHFSIYGVARSSQSDGRNMVGDILLKMIKCFDADCRSMKTEFVQAVQYHALKTDADYKTLSEKIAENTLTQYGLEKNQTSYEAGRLFYMSIPPSVVTKTVKRIRDHLLPQAGHPWVRIVLEKPFGKDKKSAQKLSSKLSDLFSDDQIYRVDHYLGKPITRLVLPFRYINREQYEPLWNARHVERVEIVMKEQLDCTGRYQFYDDVGVVRDVMQNHLTELLLLVAMEMPSNSGNITEILEKKHAVMRQVKPIHKDGVLYGQYANYKTGVIEELEKPDYESMTPTFAAALLRIDNARWQGVPFVMVSGKQLDEKSSYIRVVFKDDVFCVGSNGEGCAKKKQVVFHIASGTPQRPALVLTSPGLPRPREAQIWQHEDLKMDPDVFGESMADMNKLMPTHVEDAYASLLIGVFNGQRHLFTTSNILMASWDIWTPVVQKTLNNRDLRIYDVKNSLSNLNFKINAGKLQFVAQSDSDDDNSAKTDSPAPQRFLKNVMRTGSVEEIITKLANDIITAAKHAVDERGVFHLALSGGSSPVSLFKYLSQLDEEEDNIPWRQTHIWQVDERCVSTDSTYSNFAALNSYLLQHVPLHYHQIHPIPVHLRQEPCQPGHEVAEFYETAIRRVNPSIEIDFVVLGMGSDGHTASLFPNTPSLKVAEDNLVVFVPEGALPQRVTLSFQTINKARQVGVLVTGASKKTIMKTLQEADPANVDEFPILGVQPISGNLTFYVDEQALGQV